MKYSYQQLMGMIVEIRTRKDLQEKGAVVFQALVEHCDAVNAHFEDQPSARDLDGCDRFLNRLGNLFVDHAQLMGIAEALYSVTSNIYLSACPEEVFKRIKGSSTLVERYVNGKAPALSATWKQMQTMEKVFRLVADDYRTLISSYRQEGEMVDRTQVRTTKRQI